MQRAHVQLPRTALVQLERATEEGHRLLPALEEQHRVGLSCVLVPAATDAAQHVRAERGRAGRSGCSRLWRSTSLRGGAVGRHDQTAPVGGRALHANEVFVFLVELAASCGRARATSSERRAPAHWRAPSYVSSTTTPGRKPCWLHRMRSSLPSLCSSTTDSTSAPILPSRRLRGGSLNAWLPRRVAERPRTLECAGGSQRRAPPPGPRR